MIDNESRRKVGDQLARLMRDPEYQEFMRRNADESGIYHTSAALDDEPARDVVQRVLARYRIESERYPILVGILRESAHWGVVFLRFEPASPCDYECPLIIEDEATAGMLYDTLAPAVLPPFADGVCAVRVRRAGALADCA
ncbi:MAG: hypothetical protein ACJ73S_27745 [Mycobacteriales bacterium]